MEIDGAYPGWEPDVHSKTKDNMDILAKDVLGKEAEVTVVHAGLGRGIILSSKPDLEMV